MNRFSKVISAIMLLIAVVIAVGCTKTDDPNNGDNNGNNGWNGGDTPETPAIVSTSEVQYDGTVFIEAVFEDETKMYFEILSPNEVAIVNGEFYYQDNPSLAYQYRGKVVIPETISHLGTTYTVIAIGWKAFYGCNLVTSVFIPDSIRYIIDTNTTIYNGGIGYIYSNTCGSGTFEGCSSLTDIRMSENIQWIGDKAFAGCPCYWETITIPSTVTRIGIAAFDSENIVFNAENCSCVGGMTYPNGSSEEPICFSAFPRMTSIDFGNEVKVLPSFLYSDINPTVVDIPSSVTKLPNDAFRGCTNLEKINGLENVIEIGCSVFEACERLATLTIGNSVITIGGGAFADCKELSNVTFGNSVSEIEGHAFEGCDKLLEINLPNAISYIGSYAFWTDLNVIDTTIVSCMALIPPIIDSDVFLGRWNLLIYVPMESVDAYKAADGWGEYADKIVGI